MFINNICDNCIQKLLRIGTLSARSGGRGQRGRHISYSVVFYGSDEFSLETVKLLHQNCSQRESEPKLISRLDVVVGSQTNLISRFAQHNQLITNGFPYELPKDYYDIGIVASFGHLIPGRMISACRLGMLNIHGSLLPRWRGAAPVNYAVLKNDSITGITLMKIRPKKFDTGDIVMQTAHPIRPRITAKELKTELASIGAQLLFKCLLDLENNLSKAKPQPNEGITYAPKFDDSFGLIDFSSMTANDIDLRFRAFVGFIDVYTHWMDGTRLRLDDIVDPQIVATLDINRLSGCDNPEPGFVFYHKKRHILCISCADNTWVAFKRLSLKGHRSISALQFNNGFIRRHKEVIFGQNI